MSRVMRWKVGVRKDRIGSLPVDVLSEAQAPTPSVPASASASPSSSLQVPLAVELSKGGWSRLKLL